MHLKRIKTLDCKINMFLISFDENNMHIQDMHIQTIKSNRYGVLFKNIIILRHSHHINIYREINIEIYIYNNFL